MADESAKIDSNDVPTLIAVTDDASQEIRRLLVDPATGRLLVSATTGGGAVTSLNGLTGAVILAAGSNITLTPAGNTITIATTIGAISLQTSYEGGNTITKNSTQNAPIVINDDTAYSSDLLQMNAFYGGDAINITTSGISIGVSINSFSTSDALVIQSSGNDKWKFGGNGNLTNASNAEFAIVRSSSGTNGIHITSSGTFSGHGIFSSLGSAGHDAGFFSNNNSGYYAVEGINNNASGTAGYFTTAATAGSGNALIAAIQANSGTHSGSAIIARKFGATVTGRAFSVDNNGTETSFLDFSGNLSLTGKLGILEGGASPTKYTYIQGGDQAIDLTYTLPVAYPASSGYLLASDTSGVMSWIAVAGTGTVTSVASADGSITVTNPTTTVDLAVVKAPILSTARTIGGVSFNGSANITVATATGGFTVSGGVLAINAGITASGAVANDFSGASGTFLTSTGANQLSGAVTITDATTPSLTTAAGKTNTGFIQVNGKTSGALKIITADATAQTITISGAAQTVGATTLTIPNFANVNDTFAFLALSQALTNKTYNGLTVTSSTGTLTITNAKVFTVSNTLTLAGTDGKGINVGAATSGKILIGDGTNMVLSTPTYPTTAGTSGNILTSDGTNWTSAAPTGGSSISTTLTASENLTIGQPVGTDNFTAGNISRANRTVSSVAHGVTTPVFSGNNNQLYCAIGGNKFVYLNYTSATSDTLFAQVGSIDTTTMTMTLGTALAVATAFTPSGSNLANTAICKLDTDKFVVMYLLDASTTVIKYRVGTVSGTTITFGTEATFATAGSTVVTSSSWGADFISTDKGIMYFKAATTTNSKMFAFTASGTVLTIGTGVTPGTQSQLNLASFIKKIGTDKYVLVTPDTGTSIYAQVCTLSGTTITAGTEAQISTVVSSGGVGVLQVVSPATDVFVLRIRGSSSNIALVVACTVSGTTITAGTGVSSTSVANFALSGGIYALNSSTLYVSGGTSVSNAIQKFTLSGNTLTLTGVVAQTFTSVGFNGIIAMDNGYMVTADLTSTTLDAWIQGMSNNFIGIVQSSPSQTQTASVVVAGVDANQSGLFPGGSYLVSNGTLTFISSLTTVNTLNDLDIVKAISTTQIIV